MGDSHLQSGDDRPLFFCNKAIIFLQQGPHLNATAAFAIVSYPSCFGDEVSTYKDTRLVAAASRRCEVHPET